MMVDVQTLARQVKELEGEVYGEKAVTRHMLGKLSDHTDLLLDIQKRLAALGDTVAIMNAQFTALEPKLSGIVADAMRDVLRQKAED